MASISPTSNSPTSTPLVVDSIKSPKVGTAQPKKRPAQPPPGFKFVKVRKDGKIVTVQRKLSPEELTAQLASQSTVEAGKSSVPNSPNPVSLKVQSPASSLPTSPALPNSPTFSKSPTSPKSPVIPEEGEVTAEGKTISAADYHAALEEQTIRHREQRTSRFRNSIIRGFGTVIGTALPSVEIGDLHQGDTILDDGSDISDLSDDDEDDHGEHEKSKTDKVESSQNDCKYPM